MKKQKHKVKKTKMKTSMKCETLVAFGCCAALLSTVTSASAAYKGTAGQCANANKVNATWTYNWGASKPSNLPSGVQFYPMWWSYYGASQSADIAAANALKAAGYGVLLMYNEPDNASQSDLTTAYALQGYTHASIACKTNGLNLISPACADDGDTWMHEFMAAVKSQSLTCHAVAIHCYDSTASSFLSYVDGIHNDYGYNVYVTEFAPTDWKSPTAITVADCETFMSSAVPGLKSRGYVLDYSWYCGTLPGNNVLETAALFDSNNNLTALGTQYKSY
jgi:hypothetical protein